MNDGIPSKDLNCSICESGGPTCIVPIPTYEWYFENMCDKCLDLYLAFYPNMYSKLRKREWCCTKSR